MPLQEGKRRNVNHINFGFVLPSFCQDTLEVHGPQHKHELLPHGNMPDLDGGIAAGLSRTRQQKTRSRVRTRFKRSRSDWAALQNSGKPESDKETRAGAQDAFQRHLHLYTMGRCWIYWRAVWPAATGAKIPQGPTLVQLPGTMA